MPFATYSDADILLGDGTEFIPPMSIIPLGVEERKKTSSVSFNVEESQGGDGSGGAGPGSQFDKQETKKKNMLKRLSYPLAWMEGFSSDKEDKESLPSSGDSSQPASSHSSSVFSKVFSR
ncbi:uncharacterized protein LOC103508189 [Diaphorina citri]|uniref:Uncharacterized protein LOC103508189 n=1 Tax=Diaphorina citri TaxID=121845 RepID=A0A1S3CZC7_DIACI|nr:uncharacterized protein LOC103508189 [Diaphorina citri]